MNLCRSSTEAVSNDGRSIKRGLRVAVNVSFSYNLKTYFSKVKHCCHSQKWLTISFQKVIWLKIINFSNCAWKFCQKHGRLLKVIDGSQVRPNRKPIRKKTGAHSFNNPLRAFPMCTVACVVFKEEIIYLNQTRFVRCEQWKMHVHYCVCNSSIFYVHVFGLVCANNVHFFQPCGSEA